jgi:ubiquinone/menaquinone biosynthesis C-methylase UbiE
MFTDPIKNLKQFGLKDNMILVDLGAGTGFYSIIAAEMIFRGKVYAIDIVKDFLATIKSKAKDLDLDNLECIWGNVEKIGGTNLADNIADGVLISNILSQIEHKDNLAKEAHRILKDDGRVLIIDWLKQFSKNEKFSEKSISLEEAKSLFENNGFIFDHEIDAGITHYGIIMKKKK